MTEQKKYTLGTAISNARGRAGLSQSELAAAVGVTQGTISRIERDFPVRPRVLRATIEFLRPHLDTDPQKKVTAVTNKKAALRTTSKNKWEIAYYTHSPTGISGDLITLLDLGREYSAFLHVDAAGTGPDASEMAGALEFAYRAVAASVTPEFFTVESVRHALEAAYRQTANKWQAAPSVLLGTFDDQVGYLEVLNLGMPAPIARRIKKDFDYISHEPGLSALGSDRNPTVAQAKKFLTNQGETFMFYSDGFQEAFEQTGESLPARFMEASKMLAGDAKAVMLNLTQPKRNPDFLVEHAEDDMSAIVLSRKRERSQ
jgi:transcriptional regulator with XRE-family HTH domain